MCRNRRIFQCCVINNSSCKKSEIVNQLVNLEKCKICDTIKAVGCIWEELFCLHTREEKFYWFNQIYIVCWEGFGCIRWYCLHAASCSADCPSLARLQLFGINLNIIFLPYLLFMKFFLKWCLNNVWEGKNDKYNWHVSKNISAAIHFLK